MTANILVFIEVRDGAIKRSSLEALGEARRLGSQVAAVLVGEKVRDHAASLGAQGADRVYLVEDVRLRLYSPEGYAAAVAAAARAFQAEAIFISATALGRDLGASVAALFETSVMSDCTAVRRESERWVFRRPVYAGKASVEVAAKKAPAVATLRPNVFAADSTAKKAGTVEELKLQIDDARLKTRVREVVATTRGKVELTEASVIVSGGRGFKGPEQFELRDKLAEVLGGAVGASRAVVDNGWRPHSEQVGQTGKTVSPNLYFAIGISGAIQHLAGMSSSKVVVAINKDPDAPIFKKATYGIVGDLNEIVPALTDHLRKVLHS